MGRSVRSLLTTLVFFAAQFAQANLLTYHGRILRSDDSPLNSPTARFKIEVRDPVTQCILWQEEQSLNMSTLNGMFSLNISDATASGYTRTDGHAWNMQRVFSNRTGFTGLSGCTAGTTYTPGATDGRLILVSFKEAPADPTWQDIPITKLNYVPMSLNSSQLAGFQATEFLKMDPAASQTPLTVGEVNTLLQLISGTYGFTGDLTGTLAAPVVDGIRGVGVSATAPALNQVLKFNGTIWAPAADDTGAAPGDASYAAKGVVQFDTNLATSGINVVAGVASLPNTITAAGPIGNAQTVPIITYDAKGRLTTVASATIDDNTKLPLAGGTMTGPINMGNQNITNINSAAATNFSGRNLVLNDNDTNTVTIRTPNDIIANYILQLPANDGAPGEVLSTDGSGVLSWIAAGGGGSGDVLNNGNSFGAAMTIGTNDNFALNFETNGTNKMTILPNGNVGIDVASPTAKLSVMGDLGGGIEVYGSGASDMHSSITTWDSTNTTYLSMMSGLNTSVIEVFDPGNATRNLNFNVANVGISHAGLVAESRLDVRGTTTDNTASALNVADSAGNSILRVRNDGNIGLGNITPSTRVDISGAVTQRGMAAPAVSAAGQGRIYFDSTSNKFRVSENGGAYTDLVGSAGASNIDSLSDAVANSTLRNLFLGSGVGGSATGGANTGIGWDSMQNLTTGQSNVAIGRESMMVATTASRNTAVGMYVLASNVSGDDNTAFGDAALGNLTTGANNTAIGNNALSQLTTGTDNTAIGPRAGNTANAGSSFNIFIGREAGPNVAGAVSNTLWINNGPGTPLIYGDFSNTRLGINNITPSSTFDLNGDFNARGMAAPAVSAAGQGRIYFDSTSNKFRISENGGAYTDLVGAAGSGFANGGNSFGAAATLGTNDNFALNFETNGTNKMTVLASGNVGVGNTNPETLFHVGAGTGGPFDGAANVPLMISQAGNTAISVKDTSGGIEYGSGTFGSYTYSGSLTNHDYHFISNDLIRMTVMSSGSVGVGTTTPPRALSVYAAAPTGLSQVSIDSPAGHLSGIALFGAGTEKWSIYKEGGGTQNLHFFSWDYGNNVMTMGNNGNVGIFDLGPDAKLEVVGDLMVSATSNGDGNRFIVNSSGNVGIGTTSPVYRLEVVGPGTANQVVRSAITKTDTTYLEAMKSYVLNTPSSDYAARSTAGSFENLVSSASNQTGSYASAIDATIGAYSTGNKFDFRGLNISALNSSTGGTIADFRGLYSSVRNTSGTITNAYGGYFTTVVDSGTVTNSYGVYTGPIAGTNKYSFYASDSSAPSYFAGNVGIGTSDPQSTLEVIGNMTATGSSTTADVLLEANHFGNTASNSGAVQFLKSRGPASHPLSGDQLGVIRAQNAVAPNSWPGIYFNATENHSSSAQGSAISFQTTANTTVGGTERMRIDQNGYVGIGITNPSHILHINGAGRSTQASWDTTSDIRLKDIQGKYPYGLNEILKLNTVWFNYKKDNPLSLPSDQKISGVIAQELQSLIPEAVHENSDGYLTVNSDPVHWATVNAIQELHGQCKMSEDQMKRVTRSIASLESENKRQQSEIDRLKQENADMKARLERLEKALGL